MIGETLIAMGLLSHDGLQQALAEQHRRHAAREPIRLGELLIAMGYVTETEVQLALLQRESAGAR